MFIQMFLHIFLYVSVYLLCNINNCISVKKIYFKHHIWFCPGMFSWFPLVCCFCFQIQEHYWQIPNPSCQPCTKPVSCLCTGSHAQRTLLSHQGVFSELTTSLCLQWRSPAFTSAYFKSYRHLYLTVSLPCPRFLN